MRQFGRTLEKTCAVNATPFTNRLACGQETYCPCGRRLCL